MRCNEPMVLLAAPGLFRVTPPDLKNALALTMYSHRFNSEIHITRHASERMATRNINDGELIELIEEGTVKHKDDVRVWVAKHFDNRQDNLLCVAAVLEEKVVVKTVMHHFEWE